MRDLCKKGGRWLADTIQDLSVIYLAFVGTVRVAVEGGDPKKRVARVSRLSCGAIGYLPGLSAQTR